MEIRLYRLGQIGTTYSHKNTVGKTLPTTYVILNGNLRDSCNVRNPVIIIDISDSSNIDAYASTEARKQTIISNFITDNFKFVNYVYIPDFGRYYFIQDITLLRKNLYALSLHVDVLQHAEFIRRQWAFVSRNQNDYDILLPDERRIVLNEKQQTIFKPTRNQNNLVNTTFNTDLGANDWHVVVNFVRNIPKANFESFITDHKYTSILPNIPDVRKTFSFNACLWSLVTTPSGLVDVISETAGNDNIASSCAGVYVYPFTIETAQYEQVSYMTIVYGHSTSAGNYIKDKDGNATLSNPTSTYTSLSKELIIEDFTITDDYFNDFNDLEPYAQYEIYIPYYGWKTLNFASLRNHRLLVYYIVNFASNNATVYIYDYTDENIIWSSDCTLGVEVSVSSTNAQEVKDRTTANRLNLTLNLVGSMLSMGMGAVKGNTLASVGGMLSGFKALGQAYTSELMNYERGQVQFSNDTTALLSPQEVYIRKVKSLIKYDLDSDFRFQNGGVCNKFMRLMDLNGYTEIASIPNLTYVNLRDLTQAQYGIEITEEEVNEILTLLKNGVRL